MQLITNKYQTKLITSLIINNLHYNFIILNNKLIFTHTINTNNLYNFIILNNKLIFTHTINTNNLTKLLNKNYLKYKLIK